MPPCPQLAALGSLGREIGQYVREWANAHGREWDATLGLPAERVGQYRTVVADPPWRFEDRGSRVAPDSKVKRSRYQGYETLPLQDICTMPVSGLAHPDSHLYLWCPDALLFSHALPVLLCWGFTPKLLVKWVKCQAWGDVPADGPFLRRIQKNLDGFPVRRLLGGLQIAGGHYYRRASEVCIFATRGRAFVPPPAQRPAGDVIFAPRRRWQVGDGVAAQIQSEYHSTKPVELLELAEKVGQGPRLELFARGGREGWDVFGNQAGGK